MFRRTALRQFSSLPAAFPRRQLHWPGHGPQTVPSGSPVKFYRVRFRKAPIFSRSRIRKFFVYAIPAYLIHYGFRQVVDIDIEIEETEKVVGKNGTTDVTGDAEEVDEEEVDSLFIPFGWPTLQPRTYYKGSDPEWQEFIKFSKDLEKHKDVQLRLVSRTRSEVSQRLNNKGLLGTIDTTKGRYWLEISFPPGPPQDYEVNGLEIADEFIAWSTKIVSQKEYQQLRQVIFPTGTVWASLAAFRYQVDLQLNKVRKVFGLEESFQDEAKALRQSYQLAQRLAQVKEEKRELQKRMRDGKSGEGSKDSKPDAALEAKEGSPEPSEKRDTSGTTKSGQKTKSPAPASIEKTDISLSSPYADRTSAENSADAPPITMQLFWDSLRKNRKPMNLDPPRGTILVSGLIEVVGIKGKLTFDVAAAWDPKANDFVVSGWKARKFSPKTQSPRGGK